MTSTFNYKADERKVMKPRLSELMRHVVPAEAATSQVLRDKKQETSKREDKERIVRALSDDEQTFLLSILEKPLLTVTQRRDFLGLSTTRNNDIKKQLVASGHIEEFSVNLGASVGGSVKLLLLTQTGAKLLGVRIDERPRNCSAEHWFWQTQLASWYRKRGHTAVVEKDLGGIRADIGVCVNGTWVAVEVGITPKNEAANAKEDLRAGFQKVLIGCQNAKVLRAVDMRLASALSDDERDKVQLKLLSEFACVKELLGCTAEGTTTH